MLTTKLTSSDYSRTWNVSCPNGLTVKVQQLKGDPPSISYPSRVLETTEEVTWLAMALTLAVQAMRDMSDEDY